MSYTVYELRDSESGSIDNESETGEVWNATKKYIIGKCPGGIIEVSDAISPYLPRYYATRAGYWRRKGITIKGLGNQVFECAGEYTTLLQNIGGDGNTDSNNAQPTAGSIAWDTTGATEHMTSARGERVIQGGGNDDFGGAINLQGTSVQGIDVIVPSLKYSETWIMPAQLGMNPSFVKSVYKLTGTVNASPFRAFEPGEALFMGGRAQWSGDQPFTSVTFDFQVRANDPQFYVKGISPTPKKGWEYPWVVYKSDTTPGGLLIQIPRCLVIDVIYEEKDWSGLLIGTSPGARRVGVTPDAATAAAVAAFMER